MKLLSRLIFSFFINLIALGAVTYLIEGFEIKTAPAAFLTVTTVFTAISVFVKPVLKMIFSPIIILTFGAGVILVNMLILYILDILLADINIEGLKALFYSSLIIGLVNIIIGFSAKRLYKNNS